MYKLCENIGDAMSDEYNAFQKYIDSLVKREEEEELRLVLGKIDQPQKIEIKRSDNP